MMKYNLAIPIATLLLTAAGCINGEHDRSGSAPQSYSPAVYNGVLPGADTGGIDYSLSLEYDSIDENTSGKYELVQKYAIASETAAGSDSSKTGGTFVILLGSERNSGKKYIKLMPDKNSADNATLYFLVDSDSTLTLVGHDLREPESSGLNYTLTRTK